MNRESFDLQTWMHDNFNQNRFNTYLAFSDQYYTKLNSLKTHLTFCRRLQCEEVASVKHSWQQTKLLNAGKFSQVPTLYIPNSLYSFSEPTAITIPLLIFFC